MSAHQDRPAGSRPAPIDAEGHSDRAAVAPGEPPRASAYVFGDFTLDLDRGALLQGDREIRLRPKSFKVLSHLVERHGRLVSKDELLADVWDQAFVTEGSLTQCVIEIRRALGSHARTALRTVPRRGFIFEAPVVVPEPKGASGASVQMISSQPPPRAGGQAWTTIRARTLLAAAVLFAAFVSSDHVGRAGLGPKGRPAVALMPFDNPGRSAELDWLADGLPNLLLTGLAETPRVDLVSQDRLRRSAADLGQERLRGVDPKTAAEAARRAGAGTIVRGAYFSRENGIRIDVRLEDLETGRVLAAATRTGPDVFVLVDELTAVVLAGLGMAAGPPQTAINNMPTSSLEAYRLFSEGRTALENSRWDDARDLLERAVAIDSEFAAAYYYLTFTRERDGEIGRNAIYEQKALALLERLPERLQMLLQANQLARTGDVPGAARLIEQLIARHPGDDGAYTRLHNLYQQNREPVRALDVARRAVIALPSDPGARNTLGYALLAVGRYDEAVVEFNRYAELSPREPNPHDSAGDAYLAMGAPERALERYQRALTIDPAFPSRASLSWTLAMVGRYGEALQQVRLEQERLASRRLPVFGPVVQEAFLLSQLGRYKEAQRLLDEAADLAMRGRRPSDFISAHLLLALLWLERDEAALARTHVSAAEGALDRIAADERHWLAREGRIVVDFAAGMTELQSGRLSAARRRLARLERDHRANEPAERWWYDTLRGEIALAAGALDEAEEAFRSGKPQQLVDYGWGFERGPFLHTFRDGLARTFERRGNLSAAVTVYQQLLTPGQENRWQSVLAPRLVLALGKTLGRCGDRDTSRSELRRFLHLWQGADADLPEVDEARRMVTRSRPLSGATSPPCTG